MAWWLVIVAAVGLAALNYLLRPRVGPSQPDELKDLDDPTTDAGRPYPVVFGTITVKSLNNIWYGDKQTRTGKQKAK